ncbi:unnamed protein product, partial [Scytosiphon promiscuus]
MGGIRIESVGSMRPKGKSYDINVFKVYGIRSFARKYQCNAPVLEPHGIFASFSLRRSSNAAYVGGTAGQIRACVRRCNAGDIHCVYLESEAGMGKSCLVSALTKDPGIKQTDQMVMKAPTGEQIVVEGRNVHVVKIQGGHLEQSTPYHVLSALTASLMAIIVEPDRKGRINMIEFSEAMPTEAQRYLELLRYLGVPMSHGAKRRCSDSTQSRKVSRRQRRNSSVIGHSVGTLQSVTVRVILVVLCGSKGAGYHFQRFKGEGQEDSSEFESATELSLEAAEVLCSRMRGGIPVEDRIYGSTVFKQAFVGSQAVDWMCTMDIAGSREEAVAIGQRLVEFGLVDHVNSVFRFKDDVLFYEFRTTATTWPKAVEMDMDSGKALAMRINMEIDLEAVEGEDGEVHKACFSGEALTEWMINEYVATCMNEAVAIADKLMTLSIIESTTDTEQERFRPSYDHFYVLRSLALSALPPTHIFGLMKQLCLSILQVACVCAAEAKEVDELDFALRKLVLKSCSGSPLFISELCQSLCATEGIQKVTTSASKSRAALKSTGKDGEDAATPTSVQEIVAARIDTLESTASLVLKMSVAAYGMLLHSYRWKLHYRVAVVMTEQEDNSHMVLARHWLQVAMGSPSAAEIAEVGGDDAYRELLHLTVGIVFKAIGDLMGMGQFIDASFYFKEGLEVIKRMPDTPRKKCLEIELLLQGCQLTSFIEGYTTTLLEFARKVLFESIPAKQVVLRIEPAAILAVVLTQRGQFKQARAYTAEWKAAGSPLPLCLVMYEPVVTLLSMSVVLAAMGADDSKHLRWLNGLESYLKSDSGVSERPFNLYASMSLFGMIYPMCFEYAEMFRFYHSVYRVVYHPQVLLPIRRGLMFQTASATSRVQAKNIVITQGIEIMSLMCQAYQSITAPTPGSKKHFFNQLMGIVRVQPSPGCCAAVYQTARLLHLWDKAREILKLWDALPSFGASEDARRNSRFSNRRLTDAKLDGAAILASINDASASSKLMERGSSSVESIEDDDTGGVAVDVYECILLFCKADAEARSSGRMQFRVDSSPDRDDDVEVRLDKLRLAANLFSQAATRAGAIGNYLMEVRAASASARLLWEKLDQAPDARQRLRQIFDKFDTLCSLPNFFTPLRLTGLTAAMRLNSDMGGC